MLTPTGLLTSSDDLFTFGTVHAHYAVSEAHDDPTVVCNYTFRAATTSYFGHERFFYKHITLPVFGVSLAVLAYVATTQDLLGKAETSGAPASHLNDAN